MATIDSTTVPKHDASNDRIRKFITYTGPASYTTGGETIALTEIGLGAFHQFNAEPAKTATGTSIRLIRFDYTAQKAQWYGENFNEIANGTDLSTYSARVEVIGR